MNSQAHLSVVGLALLATLAACSGGPGESEFVQACLQSGPPGVTEKQCACVARETRSAVSGKEYQAAIFRMQGKRQEAEALVEKLSFDERADGAMKQMQAMSGCMGMD